MGFFLLDHKNPYHSAASRHWYTSRRNPIKAITIHCTAGLEDQDLIGPDSSAENTARYAATTTRQVSWHGGSDSDTFLYLLPPSYTAFHVVGYNSATYGWEISKRDMTWTGEPAGWVTATLHRAAAGLTPIARSLGIPARHATRAELDKAISTGGPPVGFISHAQLDPARRTDPGQDFPWARFLTLIAGPPPPPKEWDEMATEAQIRAIVLAEVQATVRTEVQALLTSKLGTSGPTVAVALQDSWRNSRDALAIGRDMARMTRAEGTDAAELRAAEDSIVARVTEALNREPEGPVTPGN